MSLTKEKIGIFIIAIIGVGAIVSFFLAGPVPQNAEYHNFSDTAAYLSIPNTLNVLSNVFFIIVGLAGVVYIKNRSNRNISIIEENINSYILLFGGTALVGLGSGYYHLWPDNNTLLWDRLPMTVVFMSLYAVILSEYISKDLGRLALIPLIGLGAMSVLYWGYTESQGYGDLRYYAVVQFFPVLTIPVILLYFKPAFTHASGYWVLLFSYVLAKLFEHFDYQVHQLLGVVSGHSIKHILPTIGLWFLLRSYTISNK